MQNYYKLYFYVYWRLGLDLLSFFPFHVILKPGEVNVTINQGKHKVYGFYKQTKAATIIEKVFGRFLNCPNTFCIKMNSLTLSPCLMLILVMLLTSLLHLSTLFGGWWERI